MRSTNAADKVSEGSSPNFPVSKYLGSPSRSRMQLDVGVGSALIAGASQAIFCGAFYQQVVSFW